MEDRRDAQGLEAEKETDETDDAINATFEHRKVQEKEAEKPKKKTTKKKGIRQDITERVMRNLEREKRWRC